MTSNKRFKTEITICDDIFDTNSLIHSWQLDNFLLKEKDRLNDLIGIDLSFSGKVEDKYAFDEMYDYVESVITTYINNCSLNIYIYNSEHIIQKSNRVRSYKNKLLYKDLEKDFYVQQEIEVEKGNTLFATLVKISENNVKMMLKASMDNATSFMIQTDKNLLQNQYLDLIVKNMMNHKGNSRLNYFDIISKFCPEGDIIYRIGGNITTIDTSLHIFLQSSKEQFIVQKLKESI